MIKKIQIAILACLFLVGSACTSSSIQDQKSVENTILSGLKSYEQQIEKAKIALADSFLSIQPMPIALFSSPRSQGGIHDFYSEGDYWWPDPENPDGPYIRKDGLTNPANFNEHRKAMWNLNNWVSTLVAVHEITKDPKYATHAVRHLHAFFIDSETRMNPSLLYAQAIQGRFSGRGIGIIDTIHLIEVAKSIQHLHQLNFLKETDFIPFQKWFEDYASWMNTHPYGLDEKDHGNNHSTWWAAQLAAFASLADRQDLMEVARDQFKKLLSNQMAADGSFPEELERTRPYSYSLFNLEGYAILCQIASNESNDLWNYQSKNGSLKTAWEFMFPYLENKSKWPYPADVSHQTDYPIQSIGPLFASIAYDNNDFFNIWLQLNPEMKSEEVIRTFPVRQTKLWLNN